MNAGRTLVIRALAGIARIPVAVMAERLTGPWEPTKEDFKRLVANPYTRTTEARKHHGGKPYAAAHGSYPFFLSSPLDRELSALGPTGDWQIEWKWDGIRAQLIHRNSSVLLWSRGAEALSVHFSEILEAGKKLEDGTVLDGEIVAWQGAGPLSFSRLQTRLTRSQNFSRENIPIAFIAYDILESDGRDIRNKDLRSRREQLEQTIGRINSVSQSEPVVRLSPVLPAEDWNEVAAWKEKARSHRAEGLMIKKLDSFYGAGRKSGYWWKWKVDPYFIDAVLLDARRGRGRWSGAYTDYMMGVWDQGKLVSIGKAYCGLNDAEIREVNNVISRNTAQRSGPAAVPALVLELAFENIQPSQQHKSGISVRSLRIHRWRRDKKPEEADTLASLRALMV